jgi:hypothetical protein
LPSTSNSTLATGVPPPDIEKVTVCGAIPSGSSTVTVKGAAAPLLLIVTAPTAMHLDHLPPFRTGRD